MIVIHNGAATETLLVSKRKARVARTSLQSGPQLKLLLSPHPARLLSSIAFVQRMAHIREYSVSMQTTTFFYFNPSGFRLGETAAVALAVLFQQPALSYDSDA
jgi:hypothetical protein